VTLFDPQDPNETTAAAPPAPLRRVRLLVAYDGAAFHGFAANGDADTATVAGTLRAALERVLRAPVKLAQAGRTDAGVHGWGQVVSFDAPADGPDLVRLQRSLNGLCGPHIAVRAADVVDDDFDARFSAAWRHYRYHVLTSATPSPFLAATAWHVSEPLDLAAMRLASDPFLGDHDFSSFCRKPRGVPAGRMPTMRRRVLVARWSVPDPVEQPDLLRFDIRATAFCHQMVRSITGLIVDVGRGRKRAGDVLEIIRALERPADATVAPAHGLCLWEVGY
jgi:tRNA pseudouridine38-40 synthase